MSDSRNDDTEIESAKKDMAADVSEDSSGEEPTVEEQGVMTPDQDSVEEANASGVNPDK
ncbi:MAG TPA: hypothetical protein VFG72_12385 [Marmoricola sp.]|nr:hypothetical protein [Marmoricola sp.]